MQLALVARAQGLHGELALDAHPTVHSLLTAGLPVRLAGPNGILDSTISGARRVAGRPLVKIEQIGDRAAAEAWRGAALLVERCRLRTASEDEYFDYELVGAEVIDEAGRVLGTVEEVLSGTANDVLVVATESGEVLVPAIEKAVIRVERDARRIVVDARALVYEGGQP